MKALSVRIAAGDFKSLMAHLHQPDGNEHHAYLLCGKASDSTRDVLLVKSMRLAMDADIESCSPCYVSLRPHYFLNAVQECDKSGLHIIDVHSHPFATDRVRFSGTDHASASERFAWHQTRLPNAISAGLVFGTTAMDGHFWDKASGSLGVIDNLEIIGERIDAWHASGSTVPTACEVFDRQVRAFGVKFQKRLSELRVGIVGGGGTGSHIAQQLAYLGVRHFVIVDPDRVEDTNLNRLVGGVRNDASCRHPKVQVMARMIHAVQPEATVFESKASVLGVIPPELGTCEVVFGCVDNDAARFRLSLLARRYLWLYLDLGTGIAVAQQGVTAMGGQVVANYPGSFTLACSSFLSEESIWRGRRTPEEQAMMQQHYGGEEPAPAVVSLNGVVASLAIQELLKRLGSWGTPSPILRYDALTGSVQKWAAPDPCPLDCPRCGNVAIGDETSPALSDIQRIPVATPRG